MLSQIPRKFIFFKLNWNLNIKIKIIFCDDTWSQITKYHNVFCDHTFKLSSQIIACHVSPTEFSTNFLQRRTCNDGHLWYNYDHAISSQINLLWLIICDNVLATICSHKNCICDDFLVFVPTKCRRKIPCL